MCWKGFLLAACVGTRFEGRVTDVLARPAGGTVVFAQLLLCASAQAVLVHTGGLARLSGLSPGPLQSVGVALACGACVLPAGSVCGATAQALLARGGPKATRLLLLLLLCGTALGLLVSAWPPGFGIALGFALAGVWYLMPAARVPAEATAKAPQPSTETAVHSDAALPLGLVGYGCASALWQGERTLHVLGSHLPLGALAIASAGLLAALWPVSAFAQTRRSMRTRAVWAAILLAAHMAAVIALSSPAHPVLRYAAHAVARGAPVLFCLILATCVPWLVSRAQERPLRFLALGLAVFCAGSGLHASRGLIANGALFAALGVAACSVQNRRLAVVTTCGLAGVATLSTPSALLARLSAARAGLSEVAFASDGHDETIFVSGNMLYAGGHRTDHVNPAAAPPAAFFASALPDAIVNPARRALLLGSMPTLMHVLGQAPGLQIDVAPLDAAERQACPRAPESVRWIVERPKVALTRATALGIHYDLVVASSATEHETAAQAMRLLGTEGIYVQRLFLADVRARELRQFLDEVSRSFAHVLLLAPTEDSLILLGRNSPWNLDGESLVRALGEDGFAKDASRAGVRNLSDILAQVIGTETLARSLAHERGGPDVGAAALGLVLGRQVTQAVPEVSLLAKASDGARIFPEVAERVLAGILAGTTPGWRGPPAMALAQSAISPATGLRFRAAWARIEGHDDEAAPLLEQAARLAPDDVAIERDRGHLLLDRGQSDAARVALSRVVAHASDNEDKMLLAQALVRDGDPTARLHLERLATTESRAHLLLGELDMREGRTASAEKELLTYAQAEPSDDEVFFILGTLYRSQHRDGEARAAFARGARNMAAWVSARSQEATLRLERGDPRGALVLLRQALARDPSARTPKRTRIRALKVLGRHLEAQQALDAYIKEGDPKAPENRALTGEVGRLP